MKTTGILLASLLVLAVPFPRAEDDKDVKEMRIEPASTTVAVIGKARLSVEPLKRVEGGLHAPYKVEVSNLPANGEQGQFTILLNEEKFGKLAAVQSFNFDGSAVSTEGNQSEIHGTITPSSAEEGAVKIKIQSKRGKLVFNTTYRVTR